MIAIGLFLAGLFMLVVQSVGILRSMASGVIISRSYGAPRIERATENARFDKLIRQRTVAMGPTLVLIVVGLVLTFGGLLVPAP